MQFPGWPSRGNEWKHHVNSHSSRSVSAAVGYIVLFLCHICFYNLFQLRDEELSKESQEANWFSAPSALRVYGKPPQLNPAPCQSWNFVSNRIGTCRKTFIYLFLPFYVPEMNTQMNTVCERVCGCPYRVELKTASFPFLLSGQYLNLDKDHNGMLSKEELSRYGTGTLTSVFLDRVYQECLTYDGEMVSTHTHRFITW